MLLFICKTNDYDCDWITCALATNIIFQLVLKTKKKKKKTHIVQQRKRKEE